MSSFVARLRKAATKCEFGQLTDRLIQEQILEKLHDPDGTIRRRLYRVTDLDIEKILKICRTDELANEQAKKVENKSTEQINAMKYKGSPRKPVYEQNWQRNPQAHKSSQQAQSRPSPSKSNPYQQLYTPPIQSRNHQFGIKCSRCGRSNHKAAECRIAKDKYCNKCGRLGQFLFCRTKVSNHSQNRPPRRNQTVNHLNYDEQEYQDDRYMYNERDQKVNFISQHRQEETFCDPYDQDNEYIFALDNKMDTLKVNLMIDDVPVKFLLDSGATVNIIDKETFTKLRKHNEKITLLPTCHACQVTSKPSSPPPVTMTPLPRGPWEKLCADLCGPFPSGDYLFVLVDYYSRYPVVDIIRSVTTAAVINCLQKSFATHGLPLEITTDNGPQFISKEFSHYLDINNIKHHKVTPYWPSANGEVERFNRVLKKAIQTAHTDGKDWKFE